MSWTFWFWSCYGMLVCTVTGFLVGRTSNLFMSKKWIPCRDYLPFEGRTVLVKEPFEKPRQAHREGEKWMYTSGLTGWINRGDKWKSIQK